MASGQYSSFRFYVVSKPGGVKQSSLQAKSWQGLADDIPMIQWSIYIRRARLAGYLQTYDQPISVLLNYSWPERERPNQIEGQSCSGNLERLLAAYARKHGSRSEIFSAIPLGVASGLLIVMATIIRLLYYQIRNLGDSLVRDEWKTGRIVYCVRVRAIVMLRWVYAAITVLVTLIFRFEAQAQVKTRNCGLFVLVQRRSYASAPTRSVMCEWF